MAKKGANVATRVGWRYAKIGTRFWEGKARCRMEKDSPDSCTGGTNALCTARPAGPDAEGGPQNSGGAFPRTLL